MSHIEDDQNRLPITPGHSAELTLTATETLANLHEITAGVRSDIARVREQSVLPIQIIAFPGRRTNDFLARTSGETRRRFYIYREGEPVETGVNGEDVINTYNLVLKQLVPEEEAEFQTMSEELENKKSDLESFLFQEEKEAEIETTRERIAELERNIALIKPILVKKRAEVEDGIMKIPVGTMLFVRIKNESEDIYPVMVVEDEGLKWIETMAEATPSDPIGEIHPRGFRIPLRNEIGNGALYLPVGKLT